MPEASLDAARTSLQESELSLTPKGGTGEDKGQFCAGCLSQSRCHRLASMLKAEHFKHFPLGPISWGLCSPVTQWGLWAPEDC